MDMKNNIKEFKTLLKNFNKKLNKTKEVLAPKLEKAQDVTTEYTGVLIKKGSETLSRAKTKFNQIEKSEKVKSIIEDASAYMKKINGELEQEMQKINSKIDERFAKKEGEKTVETVEVENTPTSIQDVEVENISIPVNKKHATPAVKKVVIATKKATKKPSEKKVAAKEQQLVVEEPNVIKKTPRKKSVKVS